MSNEGFKKRASAALLAAGLLSAAVTAARAGEWTGNLHVGAGPKRMARSDWGELHRQTSLNLQADLRRQSWPVAVFLEAARAESEDKRLSSVVPSATSAGEIKSQSTELCLGARKTWEATQRLRLFLGAGPALMEAGVRVKAAGLEVQANGTGPGGWADAGLYVTLWDHVNAGVRAKYSYGVVEVAGARLKAGGASGAVQVGYHF